MEKQKKSGAKAVWIFLIILFLLTDWRTVYFVAGRMFGGIVGIFTDPDYNHKADDEISRAINDAMGAKDIYYLGKEVTSDKVTRYQYLFVHEKSGQLDQMVAAVNSVIEVEDIDMKINIDCFIANSAGGRARIMYLTNYSDEKINSSDYDSLQDLHIGSGVYGSIYADPNTYINLPDIRSLTIHADIQRQAEAQGIDWYEIWPSLETVDVYD